MKGEERDSGESLMISTVLCVSVCTCVFVQHVNIYLYSCCGLYLHHLYVCSFFYISPILILIFCNYFFPCPSKFVSKIL